MSDVIIIGAGLGGLICGAILSREGKTVTVLEQGTAIGGAMQSFSRGRFRFTPGLHYVGSVSSDDLLADCWTIAAWTGCHGYGPISAKKS